MFKSFILVTAVSMTAFAEVDLRVPAVTAGEAAAGKRVRVTAAGWENTSVYHALYLPRDWRLGDKQWPVIVEFPGNGGYLRGGNVSHGTPDGCAMGYGLTAGEGAIWLCLPYIDVSPGRAAQNCTAWWGDLDATERYCLAVLDDLEKRFGADGKRVLLAGFSRGSIGCNYFGLRSDAVAGRWCGFFCHSHYDGDREDRGYAGADRASALARLKRLQGRPQWISRESGLPSSESWLRAAMPEGDFTFVAMPFTEHTDGWLLRPGVQRDQARAWCRRVLQLGSGVAVTQ
jgi:hypothetical protein